MKRFTTLNPDISFAIAALALLGIIILSFSDSLTISVFVLGVAVTYPITKKSWEDIDKNWAKIYKKFYMARTFEKRYQEVKKSWKVMWWVVPYCLFVYSVLSVAIILYTGSVYLLYSLVLGSIFVNFYISYQKSGKYYRQVK